MTARALAAAWSVGGLARRSAFAVAVATAVCGAPPAEAQFFNQFFEPPMSSREVEFVMRDLGYATTGRPRLAGDVYVVPGRNRRGERVRVIVDAYEGRVLESTVLLAPGERLPGFDYRPPALVPYSGRRQEAARPDDDIEPGPRVIPAPRGKPPAARRAPKPRSPVTAARATPSEVTREPLPKVAPRPDVDEPAEAAKPEAEKPPVTAARPPANESAPKPEAAPAASEKPPVTAARPPATEPAPKPEAPARPAAAEKPVPSTATATTAATPSGGSSAVKIVPPAPLDEVRTKAKAPPMPPMQTME